MNFVSMILWLCFLELLSDAEFREYLDENIVVGDFACDGAQVVDDLAVFARNILLLQRIQ